MNNDPHISAHNAAVVSQDEIMSALFAQMVMQQSSLAMMLLGKRRIRRAERRYEILKAPGSLSTSWR